MAFRFEELEIWKEAILFAKLVYKLTEKFPSRELFSLVDQLRRCASLIAANISEGSGSSSKKDFAHYLEIAIKSLYESVSHLQLAKEQNYISQIQLNDTYEKAELLSRKIRAFRNTLIKNS